MKHVLKSISAAVALSMAMPAVASADDRSPPRKPSQAERQAKTGPDITKRGKPRRTVADFGPRSTRNEATRSAERQKKSYGLVGRTRDGREIRRELDEDAARSLFGDRASNDGKGVVRKVVGKDNRTLVADTEAFPYSAVGLLYYEHPEDDENWYDCTGTMVGLRTMITDASCIYFYPEGSTSGDQGVWQENFQFWPALMEDGTAPYGSFDYDTAYVFEGWVDEYDGTWASTEPYAIGIITFAEDVADYTGGLGLWGFSDATPRLDAELVEYPWDKEVAMWKSTCKVQANDTEHSFLHSCDAVGLGQPLVTYEAADDSHYVIGMNIGQDGQRNVALRLHPPVFQWVTSFEQ